MDDDKVWSGFSMMARRNVARAIATALGVLIVLVAAGQGVALAAAPELTIDEPLNATATANQTPVFSGTTNDVLDTATSAFDPVTLDIYAGGAAGGTPVQVWTALVPSQAGIGEDTWEITPATLLEHGEYTAVAEQANSGLETGVSNHVTFLVESVPVVTMTSPGAGAILKTSEALLEGSAGTAVWDEPVTVAIHGGGSLSGPLIKSESVSVSGGTWSWSPHLSDGVYTAEGAQSDGVGTGTSSPVTFTVDTASPTVSVSSPEQGAVVNVADPTFTGGAGTAAWDHQGVGVAIHEGGSLGGSVVASGTVPVSEGHWSFPVTHLNDGVYTLQAEQTDEAEHTGTAAVTFTVDATAPAVSIAALASPTKDATPTLTGSASTAPWDDSSVTVAIHEGESPTTHVVTSGTAPVSAGTWSYGVAHLLDGTYTAQATQEDEAGHKTKSSAVTFTIDTTKPAVSLTKPANPHVTVSEPVFSGLAGHASGDESSITLKIYEDEGGSVSETPIQEVKSLVPNEGHEWTTGATGPRLANKVYVVVAEQADEAGNIGRAKATFIVETKSPEVTLGASGFVVHGSRLLTGPTPSFSGTAGSEPEDGEVSLNIYSGTAASGTPVRNVNGPLNGSTWMTPPVEALPDGTYTAQAQQTDSNPFSQTGVSNTITFTVDADPPNVTLTAPGSGSAIAGSALTLSGAAGTDEGDLQPITVQLYSGSAIAGQQPLEAIRVPATQGGWSAVFGGLTPGTYSAQAEQSDDVGNIGRSAPVTFTVVAASAPTSTTPTSPVASFKWIPADPQTGEPVTFASNSTAGSSPVASYAWSPAGNDVFTRGESTLTTSFSTPGLHTVQLQVTDADGLSSTVAEKVTVAAAPVPLMQPFPVVHMAGSFSGSGAKVTQLTALAPVGASVTITCRGKGCPTKSQGFLATAGAKHKSGTAQITFRRFERFLHGGVVLEIWISKHGQIGKFTRFVIHRGKSPTRTDECLNPAGTTPMVCPS